MLYLPPLFPSHWEARPCSLDRRCLQRGVVFKFLPEIRRRCRLMLPSQSRMVGKQYKKIVPSVYMLGHATYRTCAAFTFNPPVTVHAITSMAFRKTAKASFETPPRRLAPRASARRTTHDLFFQGIPDHRCIVLNAIHSSQSFLFLFVPDTLH